MAKESKPETSELVTRFGGRGPFVVNPAIPAENACECIACVQEWAGKDTSIRSDVFCAKCGHGCNDMRTGRPDDANQGCPKCKAVGQFVETKPPKIVPTRSGSTKLACAVADPKRRAWCVLPPGHTGKHQDSWGKKFTGPEPTGRLADLPRFLHANGNRTLSVIVAEELAKQRAAVQSLKAVLHQMEHGEASEPIDDPVDLDASHAGARDLQWCRNEIRTALSLIE